MKKVEEIVLDEEAPEVASMHPQKFAMWLFIVTVIMLFAGFTSAYIVRKAEGNWLDYELPMSFWVTTLIIVISSATMQWAYISAKKDNLLNLKISISLTSLLGFLFLVGQWAAWSELVSSQVYFAGNFSNPAGSFLYVFTGLHAMHLIGGIVFLSIMLFFALKEQIHSQNLVKMEMCTTYWHFLGGLWLYLYGFLLYNHWVL
ncbi:MAG: cytochrome oxidase subunit III [Cytophagales bacterium]|nr:MAG: cytochrome oxidase subunit III [Cytophagales bacterium]